jgi:putative transposase
MARANRIDFPGLPQHIIVRGNDRNDIFFCDEDRLTFLKHLGDARTERDCDVHAFVLMTNHIHLLATASAPLGLSRMVQDVGRRYVKYVNARYQRTGTLYEGRFRSSLVETQFYFLVCMRYIEMNPVRAGMVAHPAEFPWSSYRQNASGDPAGLLTPHAEYLSLGGDADLRSAAYLRLFSETIDEELLTAIRVSARQGRAFGSGPYCLALESTLSRQVKVKSQGRPRHGP